jgi:beta-lactam-binding protein with PASTA domain
VSVGPEQNAVPDCTAQGLSYADCVQKLKAAGFTVFKEAKSPSRPEDKDKVVATNPPANQLSAITNEITIVVGSGPESGIVPDCTGQTVEVCKQILAASGFTNTVAVEVDSTAPAGQIVGQNPAAGQSVPKDAVIQMQVSRGNQFTMPNLQGQFWVDAEPNLRALGWTGVLIKGANVDNSGQRSNAVVTQSPAAGTGVNYNASITLSFAS